MSKKKKNKWLNAESKLLSAFSQKNKHALSLVISSIDLGFVIITWSWEDLLDH